MLQHATSHAKRLTALGALLKTFAALWRPAPFHHACVPWAGDFPALHAALLALSRDQVEALHADASALRLWLEPWLPGMAALDELARLGALSAEGLPPELGAGLHDSGLHDAGFHDPGRDVPGRKWAQVEAFAAHALPLWGEAREVLDWCAGKAHLGRALGLHSGLPVLALERDAVLCAEAERLAARDKVALRAKVCDVLALPHSFVLGPGTLACALHACGDLHRALLDRAQVGASAGMSVGMVLAPCCYHRTAHEVYLPRSEAGRACGLDLSREDLRLAVLETTTAGQAQREAEARRKRRLLALQLWGARQGRVVQDYARLRDLARDADEVALRRACACLGWSVPDARDMAGLLVDGERRAFEVRALELIRAAMRRPLEVWLVLDMALGLEEAGFAVEVGEFCAGALTPRNLLIRARSAPVA